MTERLVIIGAGMACAYLLQQLARQPHSYSITVVGDEPEMCYNRVLLSKLLAGESAETDLAMLPAEAARRPEFITACRIVSVDLAMQRLGTEDGRHLHYDRLVFATGAGAALPTLPGMQASNVGAFRNLADARSLQHFAGDERHVLVVGAGLLGLEAAHGLVRLGCDVTVLHRRDHIMNRQLDRRGGQYLQAALERQGIRFVLGDAIRELLVKGNTLSAVRLQSDRRIATDRLVFATGIIPSTALARGAGLQCDRGIVVDAYLRTSVPGVYALGECCQFQHHCFGLVAPIRMQAEVLARELLAVGGEGFSNRRYPTQLKVSGVDIFSAGTIDNIDAGENLVLEDAAAGVYRRLVISDRRLVGAVLVGDKRGGNWYDELIRSGADISAMRPALMFGKELCNTLQTNRQAA